MKRLFLLAALISFYIPVTRLFAQDSMVVQTFTFDSTWTRRAKFKFPSAGEKFRKILMYSTLKCFSGVSGDGKYACGEWDYTTNTIVYDHRGKLDSTFQWLWNFRVNNNNPTDTFAYGLQPTYDYYRQYLKSVTRTSTVSETKAQVGAGASSVDYQSGTATPGGRLQFLLTKNELTGAGLSAGDITGIRLNAQQAGSAYRNVQIKLRHYWGDTLGIAFADSAATVFNYAKAVSAGWNDFQFPTAFRWNGTSNILVEVAYQYNGNGNGTQWKADNVATPSVLYTGTADRAILLQSNGMVNFGRSSQITGKNPRTIEAWAYTAGFNDGGLFEGGQTGAVGTDFSLRTSGTDNLWRMQQWGTPDFDITLPGSKYAWHHYAVVYDGTATRVYYDGKQMGTKTFAINTGAADVLIGNWNGALYNGRVSGLRIWNKALTAATIDSWRIRDIDPSHPDYASLIADYRLEEGTGQTTADASPLNKPAGVLNGSASWTTVPAAELHKNISRPAMRPQVELLQGTYTSKLDSIMVTDTMARPPVQITHYANTYGNYQIPDNAANHPSKPVDTITVWQTGTWSYIYKDSVVVTDTISKATRIVWLKRDSVWIPAQNVIRRDTVKWFSPTVQYEIGRYITPYGINLSLGSAGRTWVYDVTDYAQLLQDSVDLSSGNNQELLSLKFVFFKGEPPADVVNVRQIWDKGMPAYSYADLSSDKALPPTVINLDPGTVMARVRTRISGHGQSSSNGQYPHCCEWKDNTHYLLANGQQVGEWHIWQTNDCANNPLYPQGGTWLGSREGWCPGDKVKEHEFDVSSFIANNKISLDYQITPVPTDNLGMGGGYYNLAAQLIEYAAPKRTVDAEIYEIQNPNDWEYYARTNPVCAPARIILRNTGKNPLTSAKIEYQVSGGTKATYTWTGNLAYMEMQSVTMPIPGVPGGFWNGDGKNIFTARIVEANGGADEYALNNEVSTTFKLPDIYTDFVILNYKTNLVPEDNSYTVTDMNGNIIVNKSGMTASTTYSDTIKVPAPGCYTLQFNDESNDGLSYWAYQNQDGGSGTFIRMKNSAGSTKKNWNAEFGRTITYAFTVVSSADVPGAVDMGITKVDVYPNPTTGMVTVECPIAGGYRTAELYNAIGKKLRTVKLSDDGTGKTTIDMGAYPKGIYFIRVIGAKTSEMRKILFAE